MGLRLQIYKYKPSVVLPTIWKEAIFSNWGDISTESMTNELFRLKLPFLDTGGLEICP